MEHPVFRLINIFSFIMKLIFDKNLDMELLLFSILAQLTHYIVAYSYSLKTSENPIINRWKT